MIKLDDLQPNASVRGILPDCLVSVVGVQWFGSEALELTYKDPAGKVGNQLLYRHRTRAKRFRSQVRRLLRSDSRFAETPKGWVLQPWAAAA